VFKTGITSIKQLKKSSGLTFFKKVKNVSLDLYDQIQSEPDGELLSEKILKSFVDSHGTYKRTYFDRFNEFDRISYSIIKETFQDKNEIYVEDAGVSDGRTSVNLFTTLSNISKNIVFVASDCNLYFRVIEYGRCKIVLTRNDNDLVQVIFPPFVFNTTHPDNILYYPLNRIVLSILMHKVTTECFELVKEKKIKERQLLLACPAALKLMKNDRRFLLEEHNILRPFSRKYHIIRAMNILNISYFQNNEFTAIIKNINEALFTGGLFITGSNQNAGSIVNGGIYKKIEKGFRLICKTGSGSCIHDLIPPPP